jgi:HEXXH motif-containing protein
MILEQTAYEGFACPQAGLDRQFADELVVEHAKQTTEAFLARNAGALDAAGRGLAPFLRDWLPCDERFETVWNIAFGDVYASLMRDDGYAADEVAAAAALRLHECGRHGDWELALQRPVRFRFDRWLLPASDALRVRAAPGLVTIGSRGADGWRTTAFAHGTGGWRSDEPAALRLFAERGMRWRVLTPEAVRSASLDGLLSNALFTHAQADAGPELLLRTGSSAVTLIAELAQPYLEWIRLVATDLLPLPSAGPEMMHSGSNKLSPGVLALSNQRERCALAETLVHESTHQYFYILNKLGPVHDGSDSTLYFSPVRNTGRPIGFILMAYHAFANVLLFYRTALAHGLPDDEPGMLAPAAYAASLEAQMETLESALRTTRALTPLGRALWEPLSAELHR